MHAKLKDISLANALPVIMIAYGIFTKQYDTIFNCAYTCFCIIVFILIHKKFPIFTPATYYAVIVFILLSVFAGRSLKIYSIIPNWDKILHFLSGIIIAAAGKSVYIKLNGNTKEINLINFFVLLFAVSAAAVWEFGEFAIDTIFGTASQNGSLNDTMWDMILGTLSSIITIIFMNIRSKKIRR